MSKKTVLITGCSSGFGKLTANLFHEKGWNVIATMRSPEKETELTQLENALVVKLDVSDQKSIDSAIAAGLEKFGGIEALVNNAGKSGEAVFEQFDDASIQSMFDANILGLMRVTKAVLPTMRKQNEGAVINISSGAGLVPSPAASIYTATKYAVEGFTEALAIEYAPFNIKCKVIAPGAYDTNLVKSSDSTLRNNGDDQIREYGTKLCLQLEAIVASMQGQDSVKSDPKEVAEKIYECATEDTPIHNICGEDAAMLLHMQQNMTEQERVETIAGMFIPQDS